MNKETITEELKKKCPPYDEKKVVETITEYFVMFPAGLINVCYEDIRTDLKELEIDVFKDWADLKIPASWYYDMITSVKDMGLYTCEAYNDNIALRIRYIL